MAIENTNIFFRDTLIAMRPTIRTLYRMIGDLFGLSGAPQAHPTK